MKASDWQAIDRLAAFAQLQGEAYAGCLDDQRTIAEFLAEEAPIIRERDGAFPALHRNWVPDVTPRRAAVQPASGNTAQATGMGTYVTAPNHA